MRTVADQAQFVVQIVFTTSSKTLGLRSIRPATAGRDAHRPCPSVERERQLERPGVFVEDERRQVGEAVRRERAREIDGLAARSDEPELRTVAAHVTLNAAVAAAVP